MEAMKLVVILVVLVGCALSNPRRMLDCTNFSCLNEAESPVCGTDGQTYSNMCEMTVENKKRFCWMGHYNVVSKVHDGPCAPTTVPAQSIEG